MLRMGKLTDYGIVMMTYLATTSERKLSTQQIADAVKVPLPTVRKVLKALSASGLLHSERGVAGGFSLAKLAEQISIAEIVTAIEGPIALTECVSEESQCEQESHCSVQTNWNRINNAVFHALDEVKLSHMLVQNTQVQEHAPITFYPPKKKAVLDIQDEVK